MNLATAFAATAEKYQQKVALFWGDREYSYAELRRLSTFNAGKLKDLRVQPGDRVALWLKNCPEFIPALFGIWEAGAVVVPINNFLKPDEVGFILQDAGIDLIVTDRELAVHFESLRAARPMLRMLLTDRQDENGTAFKKSAHETPAAHDDDLAVIIYTSGTTGRPKGAMLSHANLLHNVERKHGAFGTAGSS